MKLRKAWLISSFGFFALFLAISAVIIIRGGNPIKTANRATEGVVSNIIAPIETTGGYRLLAFDEEDSQWEDLPADSALPQRIILLIHGLDEPGTIFDDLAPALADAGYTPLYFEYPNDQRIADSADLLHVALRQLKHRQVERVDLVCHSMGGLVVRDALTRDTMYAGVADAQDNLPDIGRWITVGTPFKDAPMAGLRLLSEWREQAVRWADSVANNGPAPTGTLSDGSGEAGEDLKPESAFLTDLNARPLPNGVLLTVIYSEIAPGVKIGGIGEELGDGVVPVWSAIPEGATDMVKLGANHRAMLKSAAISQAARNAVGAEPRLAPAIPIILDRLSEPIPPSDS